MPTYRYICPNCDFETDKEIENCLNCKAFLLKIVKDEKIWEGLVIESKYKIGRIIGGGGMGIVYEAEQIPLGRKVAIKFLRRQLYEDSVSIKRFLKEAQAAAQLNHPNIVTVHDFGQTVDGVLYLVMEYIKGKTLRELLNERVRLSYEETVKIISQVCEALVAAHRAGVIHRDLKPENIILIEQGDLHLVKILDFGIAKIVGRRTSTKLGIIGTPEYMSPEHARNQEVGPSSDLYSLACIVYECLTGKPPFVGSDPLFVLVQHAREDFKPVDQAFPGLPSNLNEFFKKALHKNPSLRFCNAEEFRRAFSDIDAFVVQVGAAAIKIKKPPRLKQNLSNRLSLRRKVVLAGLFLISAVLAGLLITELINEEGRDFPVASLIPEPAKDIIEEVIDNPDLAVDQGDISAAEEFLSFDDLLNIFAMGEVSLYEETKTQKTEEVRIVIDEGTRDDNKEELPLKAESVKKKIVKKFKEKKEKKEDSDGTFTIKKY